MFLNSIRLQNILSFKDVELELRPLNVLIGANGTGKSNLFRVLGLLRSLPKDLSNEIAEGGSAGYWKNLRTDGTSSIRIECHRLEAAALDYSLEFSAAHSGFEIKREDLPPFFHRSGTRFEEPSHNSNSPIAGNRSVLSELRAPDRPEVRQLSDFLAGFRLYRELHTGPGTTARTGISAAAFGEYLSEDGGNLARVIDRMKLRDELNRLNECLAKFFEPFEEVLVSSDRGISQIYVRERGLKQALAANVLSDGTLRLLCLLAILLDTEPAPLVCIEEPEIGMHPDAIRMIVELMREASLRTQLIVTSHSPEFVNALSDRPESVVVCERDGNESTHFERLNSERLEKWLEEYSLGELWQTGEIGGNRW